MFSRGAALLLLGTLTQASLAQVRPSPSIAAPQSGPIVVGPNVGVSASRADQPHHEVLIAADPNDPKSLLACSMLGYDYEESGTSVVVYVSSDQGKSWQESLHIAKAGERVTDPACALGPGKTAYVAALVYKADGDGQTQFFRSNDSGRTWFKPVTLPWGDREYITVDNSSANFRGAVYLHATGSVGSVNPQGRPIYVVDLSRSADAGVTFLGPVKVGATEQNHTLDGMGNGVVLSDGTFVAITGEVTDEAQYDQKKPYHAVGRIVAISSTDGGKSFLTPVTITQWYPDRRHKHTCGMIPVLAVDSSSGPFKDRLYAVWSDLRSGRAEVWVSRYVDNGKNWSVPIAVSDDAPRSNDNGPDDCMPTVAVNSRGVVGVMWYDRRDTPENIGYWPRFSASLDGGETFLPSVKVSEAPNSFDRQPILLFGHRSISAYKGRFGVNIGVNEVQFRGGDTAGLAASIDGVFHPLWVDNRTGVAQVWTASVSVNDRAMQGFPEESPPLVDVTDRVVLHLELAIYDPSKGTVTTDASLENISKEPIHGPVKMRLLSLNSYLGKISVVDSNNNSDYFGAAWDFTQEIDKGVLNAGMRSRSKRMEFHIASLDASRSALALQLMVAIKGMKVFASADTPPPQKSKSGKLGQ